MRIDSNVGLVLEGGGMRGVFTSGVLDAFMKYDVYFPYVVAVSAGACNGMCYVSRQPRRARYTNIDCLSKYHYIGLKHLFTQGCIFDPELLYDVIPNVYLPFDFPTFFKYSSCFEMVTTNCLTGRPEYLSETADKYRALSIVRASSSLPFVSKIVYVDRTPMLDGGIIDSIPVKRALSKGYKRCVVVLTRNYGFRSKETDRKVPYFLYHRYPRLRVALSRRVAAYNEQLQLVEDLEREGKIVCIRPQLPMEVKRIEKNTDRLERLYEEGYSLGENFCLNYKI